MSKGYSRVLDEPINFSLSFAFVSSLASAVSVSIPAVLIYSELRNRNIVLENPLNIWEIVLYIITVVLVIYISLITLFFVFFRVFRTPEDKKIDDKIIKDFYQTLKRRTIVIIVLIIFGILFTIGTFLIYYLIFRPIFNYNFPQRSNAITAIIIGLYSVAIIGLIMNLIIVAFSKDVIFLQLLYKSE